MNNLNVLYEDNHIIVVVKPCNILSQSDNTNDIDMLTIIKKYLKEKYQKPGNVFLGLVHRLDRPVSGIMIFAKTSKAASRLSESIRNKNFQKYYYAVVHGYLDKKEGILKNYITKVDSKKVIEDKNGKEAILEYKVVKEENDKSLIDIKLLTGRFHQIRYQFSYIGHPLVGDMIYGKDKNKQIALLAYKIEFLHPITKEKMTFEIPSDSLVVDNF